MVCEVTTKLGSLDKRVASQERFVVKNNFPKI